MPRLIDADAIFDGILVIPIESYDGVVRVIEAVKNAPTVDAIPIEWIEQYGRENWFDFGTQYNAITDMLNAWAERKEE